MGEKDVKDAQQRTIIVQIKKLTTGPWHEVAEVHSVSEGGTVGAALIRAKGAVQFRLLEQIGEVTVA